MTTSAVVKCLCLVGETLASLLGFVRFKSPNRKKKNRYIEKLENKNTKEAFLKIKNKER
jgi:hypothetical protein